MGKTQFWLRVRKEYVMENFDNLLEYLCDYEYEDSAVVSNNSNADFEDTLACMEEVADDIFNQFTNTPWSERLQLPYDDATILKLLSAIILSYRKMREVHYKSILRITMFLLRSKPLLCNNQEIDKIIVGCILKDKPTSIPIGWGDILPERPFLSGAFEEKFLKLSFKESSASTPIYYLESRGLLLIGRNITPSLSLFNLENYRKIKTTALATQISVHDRINFMVKRSDYDKNDAFSSVQMQCKDLLRAQTSFTPSHRRTLKRYASDDSILVRVTEKRGFVIKAETIDTDYVQIEGRVNLRIQNAGNRPPVGIFSSEIKVGDYLTVNLSEGDDYAFEVEHEFEKYYRDYAAECFANEFRAVYFNRFSKVDIWVTDAGVHVGVHDDALRRLTEKQYEEYRSAIEYNETINLTFYTNRPAVDRPEFFVYATVGDENGDVIADESLIPQDAYTDLFRCYLEDHAEMAQKVLEKNEDTSYAPLDNREGLQALMALMFAIVNAEVGGSVERLQAITIAEFLSRMLGRDIDAEYLSVKRNYLCQLVAFASNKDITQLNVPGSLEGNSECRDDAEIVDILSTYRKKELLPSIQYQVAKSMNEKEVVRKLVESSNSLLSIIDNNELDRIKRMIATSLGVEDEYSSMLDSRTYYGVESSTLELKTSVVFPPVRPGMHVESFPNPEYQKWNIRKAVCGFLNSHSGGDLLIGVSDLGYAVRLDDDLRELTRLGFITLPNMDHYRNYIARMLDSAFSLEADGQRFEVELSRKYISVDIETNEEKMDIIRVKVLPYKNGKVYLSSYNRPASFKPSYIRKSGRSVELIN